MKKRTFVLPKMIWCILFSFPVAKNSVLSHFAKTTQYLHTISTQQE